MPSNSNGRVSAKVDAPDVKAIVFGPSVPMAKAFAQLCARRQSELFGTDYSQVDNWLDQGFIKGIKADIVRDALTEYLGREGFEWDEPVQERTSSLMLKFRNGTADDGAHPKLADESDEAYSERYEQWKSDRQAAKQRADNQGKALQLARMEKLQSLLAMGTNMQEAYDSMMAALPDGMVVVKREKSK